MGVGAGRAKWGFLPFAHTDFIFAVIGEEFGLVGATVVIGLFVLLGVLGVRTAVRAPDPFGMLLAAGVTAWFVAQAFVNIGAVVGVLPVTGVPLPFVSAGGSSLAGVDGGRRHPAQRGPPGERGPTAPGVSADARGSTLASSRPAAPRIGGGAVRSLTVVSRRLLRRPAPPGGARPPGSGP